ncbi:hypothetical protein [Sphingomonas aracearum]|uniref:Uncharacterized protein n=1 Tax=Sphingomonas aracearum TaxID=2283317 RepID=A0A369VWJ9_9SPHN|nr:hypothetical protein [Sphingomonas aracearum]RDE05452.1 hypothetical protein DVW87_09400 [Sphingomonas aracearum]
MPPSDDRRLSTLKSSVLMLCFGLGVLAFLVAIERPHWFEVRPATGTAAAMSAAAAPAPAKHL